MYTDRWSHCWINLLADSDSTAVLWSIHEYYWLLLISNNLGEKSPKLTLLSRKVEFCVIGESLDEIQLDIIISVQDIVGLGFLKTIKIKYKGLLLTTWFSTYENGIIGNFRNE